MPTLRRIQTNFSKGELSPKIEGRPDLAAYFAGGSKIENFVLLRQGGLERRFGLKFIREIKSSNKDTILLPFEASVDDAFIIELGDIYARFYKNKDRLGGDTPIEVVSPYTEAHLRLVHFTQSVDVLFTFHSALKQHKLSRVSDTEWFFNPINFTPPPSYEKDFDVSEGVITLTPGAAAGNGITFTASAPVFMTGDVNRIIISGVSRATIKTFTDSTHVVADITDAFPSTAVIPAGKWFLKLPPQMTLNPTIREPIGATVTLVGSLNGFRPIDVSKFIVIYGGLVEIKEVTNATTVVGILRSEMGGTDIADPPAAAAGTWTLEFPSWSSESGYPRTGEFFQGRLGQASTPKEPTTFWLSKPDNFESYPIGTTAGDAITYTVAARKLNRLEWMADRKSLYLGSSGAEIKVSSGKTDEPFGGDIIPLANSFTFNGSAPIQPVVVGNRIVYIDRSRKKILTIAFDIEQDDDDTTELTGAADHITGSGIKLGPTAFANRPDPRIYYIREDGQLITLTYFKSEKVIGFTRLITDGFFESVAVKPHPQDGHGGHDEVWVIVRRIINGQTKRYVEMFEDHHEPDLNRPWGSLQTDCAIVYQGTPIDMLTNLQHLEGKTVDIIADGVFIGTRVVTNGRFDRPLQEKSGDLEVGIHYDSDVITMRPGIENQVIEGLPRSWDKIWLRMHETKGGQINGKNIHYKPQQLGVSHLFTGDKDVTGMGWDDVGRIHIKQNQPYPMTILAVFGRLSVGDD